MTTLKIIAKAIDKGIAAEHAKIVANEDRAARAAATVFVPFIKAALPRDSHAARPGYLRSHVHVYRVAPETYKVKLTGSLAHLVFGDTKEHTEGPAGSTAAQAGFHRYSRRSHGRMQGPGLAKQALSWGSGGNVYSRVTHRAHHGALSPLPRINAEHAPEARAAAAEVLFHGK